MKQNSHFNRVVLSGNSDWCQSPTVYAENKEQDNHTLYTTFSK